MVLNSEKETNNAYDIQTEGSQGPPKTGQNVGTHHK